MLPIPGTKRLKYLEQNAGADSVTLTDEESAELAGFNASGTRYPEASLAFVNG